MGERVVIESFGHRYAGALLYHYDYPKALLDKQGRVYFEQRSQRAGLRCDDGVDRHFTVHFIVDEEASHG